MSRLSDSLRRYSYNLAAGGVGQVINLVTQLISIPLFLHAWSKPFYGEWLVLTSIPSLLWCFEGGLAGVAVNRMTVASASENWPLVNTLFQNVIVLQSILCTVIFAGSLFFVHLVNVSQFLHFTLIGNREASIVLVVMILYMITGFYINLLRAAYRSSILETRGAMALNLWRLVDLLVIITVLLSHGHVVRLALGLELGALTFLVLEYIDVRRHCPRIEFGIHLASWHKSRELMVDGAPLLAGMAASALALQGYPLLVNRALGASAVVNLTTVRTVCRTILQGIQILSNSSAAELSRTYGRRDWEGYLRLLKIIVAAAFWGGLFSCIAMPFLGPLLIKAWTGGKITVGATVLFLFAITIALQGAWSVCSTVLVACNMHHTFNYTYLVLTALALSVTPLVCSHLGFTGIPVVMVGADLSLLCAAIYLCHKKLTHITLGDLLVVFQPSFYFRKAAALKRKMVSVC